MKHSLPITFLLCLQSVISFAQEIQQAHIGVEAGLIVYEGEVSQTDKIRKSLATNNTYNYSEGTYSLNTLSHYTFFGTYAEQVFASNKFGVLAGFRFMRVQNSIQYNSAWTNQTYFYYLYKQDSLRTDYLKVKTIKQQTDYISIPIELKYYWFRRPYRVSPYVIVGTEIRYRMKSKTSLQMYEKSMNIFEDELLEDVSIPRNMQMTLHGGIGIKLGKEGKPTLHAEANVPFLFLPKKSYGIINPDVAGGIRISAQFPLNNN